MSYLTTITLCESNEVFIKSPHKLRRMNDKDSDLCKFEERKKNEFTCFRYKKCI